MYLRFYLRFRELKQFIFKLFYLQIASNRFKLVCAAKALHKAVSLRNTSSKRPEFIGPNLRFDNEQDSE